MVVGKGDAFRNSQTSSFETRKELLRAGDAAEGQYRAVDPGHFHAPPQSPDRSLPAPCAEFAFQIGIVSGNRDHAGPVSCPKGFTQVSGGEKAVLPVLVIQQQDVHFAMKLAVLEAVVENVETPIRMLVPLRAEALIPPLVWHG